MLVDHRTYTVKPGTMAKQMALYQEYGWKPQTRHLGQPLAYLITESGEVNTDERRAVRADQSLNGKMPTRPPCFAWRPGTRAVALMRCPLHPRTVPIFV